MYEEVVQIFEKVGALLVNGHFVYASGEHGHTYINKDALFPHTDIVSKLAEKMVCSYLTDGIDVVVGPEKGGIILSQWVAYHLSFLTEKKVYAVFAEKDPDTGDFVIKRGYEKLIPEKRILIVEDILTTGGSVRKVVEEVRALRGDVVGVSYLWNRGGVTAHDVGESLTIRGLVNQGIASCPKEKCELCEKGIPVNEVLGHGKAFLENRS